MLEDLSFANDLVLLSRTRRQPQLRNDHVFNASQIMGLKINFAKMKVMRLILKNIKSSPPSKKQRLFFI